MIILGIRRVQIIDPRASSSHRGGNKLFIELLLLENVLRGILVHRLKISGDDAQRDDVVLLALV